MYIRLGFCVHPSLLLSEITVIDLSLAEFMLTLPYPCFAMFYVLIASRQNRSCLPFQVVEIQSSRLSNSFSSKYKEQLMVTPHCR